MPSTGRRRLSPDAGRIVAGQAARALAYGLGSVLLGVTLARHGRSGLAVGLVLTSILAGNAIVSVLIARYGDRIGRRRTYRLLFVGMAVSGAVFALVGWFPALVLAALTGIVSTDVVESGPFTSLEQTMLPDVAAGDAAAAYTNTARYATRPFAPLLAGVALRGGLGVPFLAAGAIKRVYDVGMYAFFRKAIVSA